MELPNSPGLFFTSQIISGGEFIVAFDKTMHKYWVISINQVYTPSKVCSRYVFTIQIFSCSFFRERLGGAITKGWVKILVLALFSAYMYVAIYGFTNIKEGLDKKNTANYDSYSIKYYDMDDTYFKKYALKIREKFCWKTTRDAATSLTPLQLMASHWIDPTTSQNMFYLTKNHSQAQVFYIITIELINFQTFMITFLFKLWYPLQPCCTLVKLKKVMKIFLMLLFTAKLMPCPFTGPKKFWAGPNFFGPT